MPQRQQLLPPRTVSHTTTTTTTTTTTPRQLNFMRSWQLCFLVGGRKLTHPYKAAQLTSPYFTILNAIIPHHTTPHLISPQPVPGRLCLQGKLYDPHYQHTHTHTTTRRLTSAQRERVPMLSPCSNLPHTAPSCYLSITLSRLPTSPTTTNNNACTHARVMRDPNSIFFYARIFFNYLVL